MVALGHEPLGFEEALAAEATRCAPDLARLADPSHDPVAVLRYSYLARGRYAGQLERWLDRYPADRLLVIRSEDFFTDTAQSFHRIVDFIGLSPWEPRSFVNVSRQGRDAPPPIPAPVRARLAAVFDEPNRELRSLLGSTAPRW
jgi:hypothetical protein